ncbi:MAG: HD domain-containing protein, partial [Candidatus Bathyarchaeota archaeon]|nr:HD domain-containing protein [Candidatus Bathyarchaeota archaeon]
MLATNEESSVLSILGWEKNIKRYVLDPIHGPIGITDLEFKLINSEVFVRLKNIKQLGFASNVYPSATHTRFEHSLGTLAITWDILKRILKKLEENSESDVIHLFTDDVIKSFRLAALLHDLGHGPFSHSLEDALEYLGISFNHDELTPYLLSFKLRQESIDSIKPSFDTSRCKELRDSRRQLAKILKPKLRRLVLAIINRDFRPSPNGFDRIRFLLHDALGGDIGSDRMDYLLRDTYFTGLGHRFSLSEILDKLYYVYDKVNDHLILAIKSEGKAALELMLLTRYFHYQFIAHHPKNVKLTAILQRRIRAYLEENNVNNKRREREKLLVYIALSNDWIEDDLPPSKDVFPIHRVTLLDFQNFVSRFLFYRVIEDFKLRSAFQGAIENYILEKYDINARNKMLFNFSVGKPRVPIIHYYMDKYMIGTVLQSALVHDNSPFLLSLGRAYIENSSMTIYIESDLKSELERVFDSDPDFYKETDFLENIIRKVTPTSLNMHDYLLFIITTLLLMRKDRVIKGYRQITDAYKRLKGSQQPGYDYAAYEKCYNHETNSTFDCPSRLFNALILFDVCKFINIELVTFPYKKVARAE